MTRSLHRIIEWVLPFLSKLQHRLFQWRILVLLLVAGIIFRYEVIEHPDFLYEDTLTFFKEIYIYFSLIIIILIMIELTIKANIIKNQNIKILNARHNLSMQLTSACDWNEVVSRVLQYPSSITSILASSLLIYDQDTDKFTIEQSWIAPNIDLKLPILNISRDSCCKQDIYKLARNVHLVKSAATDKSMGNEMLTYHIPLNYGGIPTGIMVLYISKHKPLEEENIQLLSNTAEDMAIGLNATQQRMQQHAIAVSNATSKERLEIARDLHDTLGQNLGYMHLKLDQIVTKSLNNPTDGMREDLRRLQEIANESYELVRNTLIILHDHDDHRIKELFTANAELIAKRTGMEISINEKGQPHTLPPEYLKQLLFAYKESLSNIEKHSGATEANVCLSWTETKLNVDILDNGIGFEQKATGQQGHYGLNIINDRINALGGEVVIHSIPAKGTEVIFQLPLSTIDMNMCKK